ncbi:MAG: ComF family protein [bacterium]|nr:MAG: ComF family protein [bacterium]
MKIIAFFQRQFDDLLQLLYPPLCLGCRTIIEERGNIDAICGKCLQSLTPVPDSYTRQEVLSRLSPCYLEELFCAFQFDDLVQSIIHEIKYRKAPKLARQLASQARSYIIANVPWLEKDPVIPVPLFRLREKERGFNQSRAISEGVFAGSENPVYDDILFRSRPTQSQTELHRDERLQNISGAFTLKHPERVKNKNLILVDDVVTTGATLNECARILKEAGAEKIWGLTLAAPLKPLEEAVTG